jgi:transcriptional regulator with XRE-family HTH domain
MTTLGEAVRTQREVLKERHGADYTLRSVAARTGLSPGAMSRIETGTLVPEEATLRRIADALGMDAGALLGLAGRIPADVSAALATRPELAEIVRRLAQAPASVIAATIRAIDEGDW